MGSTVVSPRHVAGRPLLFVSAFALLFFCGIIGYIVMLGKHNIFGADVSTLLNLTVLNGILLLLIVGFMSHRIYAMWKRVKTQGIGFKLQKRILITFALVAIIPTLCVAIFSTVFFNVGIRAWFSDRVSIALTDSLAVAEAYLEEHGENIRIDALAMARDIEPELPIAMSSPSNFRQVLNTQTILRGLSEAIVFTPQRVMARSDLSLSLAFEQIPPEILARAREGRVVLLTDEKQKIRALIQLDALNDMYLLIGRLIDSKVIKHMQNTQGAVTEYAKLKQNITMVQNKFTLFYIMVALFLLLISLWVGFYLAMRIVSPIAELINATDRVKAGDYTASVPEGHQHDEIATLARTFNRMTQQLGRQRDELINANRRLDERRRMMEAVFSGVSAGVIALDEGQRITVYNKLAFDILSPDHNEEDTLEGEEMLLVFPEVEALIELAKTMPGCIVQDQIKIMRAGTSKILNLRISTEEFNGKIEGFIVTFDDVTPLVTAQRNAAWADVARRIAHEIKNPLTPIQLSTERIKHKFAPEDKKLREPFDKYIETIQKHVADIGTMVDEFGSFARMPRSILSEKDLLKIIKQIIFSENTVHPKIKYIREGYDEEMIAKIDERHIGQLFTNLLKNAAEGIELYQKDHKDTLDRYQPEIRITSEDRGEHWQVTVEDNGTGFPEDKLSSLTEPYVTTRAKGTGLGLAIVKKHMEDHGGSLTLSNRAVGGAKVTLAFPKLTDVKKQQ